jgi:hypothetical protein
MILVADFSGSVWRLATDISLLKSQLGVPLKSLNLEAIKNCTLGIQESLRRFVRLISQWRKKHCTNEKIA